MVRDVKYLEQCSDKAIYTPILQVLNPASKPQERIAIILYRGSNRRAVGAGCEPLLGRESAAQNSPIGILDFYDAQEDIAARRVQL